MAERWAEQWDELAGADGVPVMIYGHSMGVLVAYEVTRRLQKAGSSRMPTLVVLGARNPPHAPRRFPPLHHLSNDAFLQAVAERYGNLPTALLEDAEMRELIAPVLKADFKLVDDYAAESSFDPLTVPLKVLVGVDDSFTTEAAAGEWAKYTVAGCTVDRVEGGHFFHQEQKVEMVARMAKWAEEVAPR